MQSLEQYLDATFHSPLEVVSKIDDEHRKLRAKTSELERTLAEKEQQAIESKTAQIQQFKDRITEIKDTVSTSSQNDSIDDTKLTELLSQTSNGPLNSALRNVSSLVETRNVLRLLCQLKALSSQLDPLVGKLPNDGDTENTRKALELYGSIASIEDELRATCLRHPSPSCTLALANQGLAFVESSAHKSLQTNVQTALKQYLAEHKWPKDTQAIVVPEFLSVFTNALRVSAVSCSSAEPADIGLVKPLLAFETLVEPIVLRLKYNFSGSQPTNRIDKPEWMFSYIISTIDKYQAALTGKTSLAQQALQQVDRLSDRVALHEFITALLPFVYGRVSELVPRLVSQSPHIYLHLISELLSFDSLLKSRYLYSPYGNDPSEWGGITDQVMAQDPAFFTAWVSTEKEMAILRYNEIIASPKSFEIDWDSKEDAADPNSTFYTYSAVNVRDLLAGVTQHYKLLNSVTYRLRVLLNVQIAILDAYYTRLEDSLTVFESMSSTMARAVGGLGGLRPDELSAKVSGLNGIETLCRTYGSLQCIGDALVVWGQDLFFLDLWQDLCQTTSSSAASVRPTNEQSSIPGQLPSVLDSPTLVSLEESTTGKVPRTEDEDGTLFDETIASYTKLRLRVIENTMSLLKKELSSSMKPYFQENQWRTVPDQEGQTPKGTSPSLMRPLRHMGKLLEYLKRFHSVNDYNNKIARPFAATLSKYFWNHIIQANQFTTYGAAQLGIDVSEMIATFNLPFDTSLKRVQEAVMLLREQDKIGKTEADAVRVQQSLEIASLSISEIQSLLARRL